MRTSSPTQTTGQTDATAVRSRILQVTLHLLEEHGYSAVTTESIATEARVSKATIYRLWTTKQQLVVDAARSRFSPVDVQDLGSFQKEIRWILEHRLADYRRAGTLRLVGSLVGAATTDPKLRAVFDDWIEHLTQAIRLASERGVKRGDVRSDIDLLAVETLVAGVVARTVITQASITPDTVDELAALIAQAAQPR